MSDYQRWIKTIMKEAQRLGWVVTINGHIKFRGPSGQIVCCSVSPRNGQQVMHSVKKDLRRAGLQVV